MNWSIKIFFLGFMIIGGAILNIHSGLAQEIDYQPQVKKICQQLVCLCGCGNMILDTCDCGEADKNKQFILKELKQGKNEQEILDIMVSRYGEKVLAAPRREGINWIIWVVVPYVIPVLGAIGLAFLIVRWATRRKPYPKQDLSEIPTEKESSELDKYKQKLEEELKNFE
jgi:cytochrome c-type biogenesis protein CcmH/NrfF